MIEKNAGLNNSGERIEPINQQNLLAEEAPIQKFSGIAQLLSLSLPCYCSREKGIPKLNFFQNVSLDGKTRFSNRGQMTETTSFV